MSTTDSVFLSADTAAAFNKIGMGDFYVVEKPERMAWVLYVLKQLPDRPQWFPKGKWATLQSIEHQLDACGEAAVAEILLSHKGGHTP